MREQAKAKIQMLKIYTEFKDFKYEPPKMYYDKESGEIKIKKEEQKSEQDIKRVIRNVDDLKREKEALFEELGLTPDGELN